MIDHDTQQVRQPVKPTSSTLAETYSEGVQMTPTDPAQPRDPIHDHPAVTRVAQALAQHGLSVEIVVLDGAARTAAQAAAYLGVRVGQIANSLVFAGVPHDGGPEDPPEPVLVLTSGAHRVDTAVVAARLGLRELGRADAAFVREHTGFVIGGVAPVGHRHPVRTAVDEHLADYPQLWAAAGHPHTVFSTTYADLLRLTGGVSISVC